MNKTADVVVIGAGVTGASITFHLAERGLNVICVERNYVASGATGSSSALVRMHYDNEPEMKLAHLSYPYFNNWLDMVGKGNCRFIKTGFIRLVDSIETEKLQNNVGVMKEMGVNTSLIGRDEIRYISDYFYSEDIEIAAWEPDSGYADPIATTLGFFSSAESNGAKLLDNTEVISIKTNDSRITGVNTTDGFISSPSVVNAAGAFASNIAKMVDVDLPVEPIRYQAGIFRRPEEIAKSHPIVMDRLGGQFYFRPEGNFNTLVGGIGAVKGIDPNNFNESTAQGFPNTARDVLSKRIIAMRSAVFQGGRAACDGISRDEYAIIGNIPDVEGFYCAVGDSGHGFKIAPAVGLATAELITNGVSKSVDISAFRFSRFKEGVNPFTNPNIYGVRSQ